MTDIEKLLAFGIALIVAIVFTFVPTMIAYARHHPERRTIGQINILAIVSFLLWAALIAWAVGGARNDSVIGRFVGKPGQRGRLAALVVVLVGAGVATTAYALTHT